ncbi:MAG: hypothetical protein J7454_18195 [Roseiflexus sp.]|nr:hypothetical protein [Roseiflexus sp.]
MYRALWDASATTFDAALQRVNALVLEKTQAFLAEWRVSPLHLLDLECGLGGTLRRPIESRCACLALRCR